VARRDEEEGHRVAELSTLVRAAGGVVWRTSDGVTEIALVHRPRYDDWTLPKGKLDRDEHPLAAAVREVFEETAVRAVPQTRLHTIRYLTGQPGVEKIVDFWSMRAASWAARQPDDEVDQVRWVPATDAAGLLSYSHDRGVVKAFAAQPPVTAVVAFMRHARAGKRERWRGPDAERPLDEVGEQDAAMLCTLLALLLPSRIVTATPLRCRQTVAPLAEWLGVQIDTDPAFDENADPQGAVVAMRSLAERGGAAVVCSQAALMAPALATLTHRQHADFDTAKGRGWILAFSDERLVRGDYLDPRS
jgi:8-oxo-dGTP diphosphatase